MLMIPGLAVGAALAVQAAAGHSTYGDVQWAAPAPPSSGCAYPANCPRKVLPRADKQTWMMNKSTIIMPCNESGLTDPQSTKGWGIV